MDLVVPDTNASSEVVWGGGYRPYFENYTVDASILDMSRKTRITIMI